MDFRPPKLNKSLQAALLVLAVVLVLVWLFQTVVMKGSVPGRFTEARQNGSRISGEIVVLLSDSLKNLEKIGEADRKYNFAAALGLVRKELEKIREIKQKAAELTGVLDKMARAVPDINPAKARNLALEAVSSELSLISYLMIYNDSLNGLLETLRLKFSGDISYDAKDVQVLIGNLNKEALEINALNDLFNQKMKEFDRVTR